ncbi:MAG: hydrolase [Parcubacteria group bacterium]|nr:hydrolase [Parcubacteria group bacterium]
MAEPAYAIGYIRLSDASQLKGGGRDNQEDAILHYIARHGLKLYKDKLYEEVWTGTTNDRPVFNALLQEIAKNKGKIKFFVIKKLDRGSRGGSGDYFAMKLKLHALGVELRDVEGIIQPSQNRLAHRNVGYEWSETSASHIAEAILSEISSEDRKNILTRTVDTSISRVETGYKLREANYGYQNKRILTEDGQYKYIQIPLEPEATYIRTIFEDSAASLLTDEEIVKKLKAMGAKTRSRNQYNKGRTAVIGTREGQPISVKQMQRWRKNPIYCGVNEENWGKTQKRKILTLTQYDGLVTIELFNRANRGKVFIEALPDRKVKILYNLKPEKLIKRRLKFREDFLFKNVVLCPSCRKPFKASASKSKSGEKVPYYHCDRDHKYYGVPKDEFEKEVYAFINDIKFSDQHYEKLKKFLTVKFMSKITELNSTHIEVDENIIKLRRELNEIYTALKRVTAPSAVQALETEYEQKLLEIQGAREERRSLELTEDDLNEFLEVAKQTVEHPSEILVDVHSFEHQIAVNKLFFEELPTYEEVVNRTPKLTLFFKVLSANTTDKALNVTPRGIEPRFQP